MPFSGFQRCWDNLISNAIKFTDHGSIEVSVKQIDLHEVTYLEFYVKDTGKGIPPEKLNIIFERFRQVEKNEYHEGAGLGLSIAKALVGLLGGEIRVASEVRMMMIPTTMPFRYRIRFPNDNPA
ncbi:MAG: hypothetical protein ISS17_09510 [Bacteroidales bacterium]|nr:hypothetical protein [Bacteroidales bacterium]